MMVMTAKVDLKKIMLILAGIAAVIVALILILGDGGETAATASPSLATNDGRVQFLESFGWDVTTSPVQSTQVKIPKEMSDVFRRYNALQLSQGYDLSKHLGESCKQYSYRVLNYPDQEQTVLATLYVQGDKVIAGDIHSTELNGFLQGLAKE